MKGRAKEGLREKREEFDVRPSAFHSAMCFVKEATRNCPFSISINIQENLPRFECRQRSAVERSAETAVPHHSERHGALSTRLSLGKAAGSQAQVYFGVKLEQMPLDIKLHQ